jgi:transglutaminase-like putative cysteine protease
VKYHTCHITQYRYDESVSNSQHDLHLLPRNLPRQRCLSAAIAIEPAPIVCHERVDYYGNRANHVVLATPHSELIVTTQSDVEVTALPALTLSSDAPWESAVAALTETRCDLLAQEMAFPSPFVAPWAALADYARPSFPSGRPLLEAAAELMGRVHADFTYDPRATTIATPLAEVLEKRRGVCQDFAHLMIACLRAFGLSALYVSGYLVTSPPPGQPRLQGADASHAWLAVWSPRFGFVDLDPTNNLLPSDAHITLAIGRDFGDVTPLRGVILGGGRHELRVGVDVEPYEPGG